MPEIMAKVIPSSFLEFKIRFDYMIIVIVIIMYHLSFIFVLLLILYREKCPPTFRLASGKKIFYYLLVIFLTQLD
jgi:hypothetical protein